MASSYQVYLIDDETGKHKGLKERWLDVFEKAKISVNIQTSDDFDLSLSELGFRPHYVIVDNVRELTTGNRLKEQENRGIEFIAANKVDWQDTVFILSTKETFSIDVLGHKFPNPDLIVPKTALSNKAYRKKLGEMLSRQKTRTSFGRLNIPDPTDSLSVEPIRPNLISVLEQCIHAVARPNEAAEVQQINLESLSGGFSGSLVFKAKMFDADQREKIPLVVKVSEGDGAIREVSCYNSFVRLQMPHDMRVDLLGYGEAGNLRGALYAFAVGSVEDLESFSDIIGRREYEFLDLVIDRFFLSSDIGWYKNPKDISTAESFYGDSEEYDHEKDSYRLSNLKDFCNDLLLDTEYELSLDNIRVGSYRFKFVRKYLEAFDRTRVHTWIGHGDFNTNNIIFGRNNSAVSTIDFEYSGPDCVYKDFISLECSLRIDDCSSGPDSLSGLEERAAEEFSLNQDVVNFSTDLEYLKGCQSIRIAAQKAVEEAGLTFDQSLYCLALSFHLFKLLGITGLNRNAKSQLLSAFLASGKCLEQ